jgi:hypothetical protein
MLLLSAFAHFKKFLLGHDEFPIIPCCKNLIPPQCFFSRIPVDLYPAGGRIRCVDQRLFYGHALFVSPPKGLVNAPQGGPVLISLFSCRIHSYQFAPVQMVSMTVHCKYEIFAGFKKPAMASNSMVAGGQSRTDIWFVSAIPQARKRTRSGTVNALVTL